MCTQALRCPESRSSASCLRGDWAVRSSPRLRRWIRLSFGIRFSLELLQHASRSRPEGRWPKAVLLSALISSARGFLPIPSQRDSTPSFRFSVTTKRAQRASASTNVSPRLGLWGDGQLGKSREFSCPKDRNRNRWHHWHKEKW